ncbi:MAG: phosphatase [Promethearchaeota archaeon CR_4]|nr:MAG: phosphatase [Candidatus Lokiarchaeota archaeon CR_4]
MVSIHKPRTIREGILVAFAVFAIIALGSVAATAGIFSGVIGTNTSDQTSAALTATVQYDMQNKTYDYARNLQAQFNKTARDLDSIAEAVANVFSPNFEFGYRRAYYHVDFLEAGTWLLDGTQLLVNTSYPYNVPPDVTYNPKIKQTASASYSDYLLYYDTYQAMGKDETNFTGPHGDLINRTSHLDPIFRDILASNPAAAWIYIDYKIGIQRTFPWSHTDETIFGHTAADRNDYKTGDWYVNAHAATGKVVWTDPEIDEYIGWFVSASRALYNGTPIEQNFIGCVGIDFRLDVLNETVGNIKLYNNGYGFLINKEGAIISHPKVIFDPEVEEPAQIEDVEDIFGTGSLKISVNTMTSGKSGIAPVRKDNANYYLAYAPVTLSDNSNYTLGIIVPQEEVLAPVRVLEGKILLNLGIQLGIIFGILGIVLVAAISVGVKTSDSIVRPITKLTNLALQLSTEDVKKTAVETLDANFDRDLGAKEDEIGSLARSFKNLVKMVQEEGKTDKKGAGSKFPSPE